MAGGPGDDVARHFAFTVTRDAAVQANLLANEYLGKEGVLATDPVLPKLWTADSGPFSFEIQPEQRAMLTDENVEVIAGFCRRAVKERLALDSRDLAGLIVGHARIGQNFFDYF